MKIREVIQNVKKSKKRGGCPWECRYIYAEHIDKWQNGNRIAGKATVCIPGGNCSECRETDSRNFIKLTDEQYKRKCEYNEL